MPKTAAKPPGPAQEGTNVVHGFVQAIKGDFEGVTVCAAGLPVLPNSFYVKAIEDGSIEQSRSRAHVRSPYEEFDAPEKIGPKPIHANGVLVSQETFDIGGIQDALKKERVWQVSETTEEHEAFIFG